MTTAPRVLIVDDCADDRFLFARALRVSGLNGSVVEIEDGEKASEYLQTEPPPDFVLLDLKMPLVSGFEVLEWIRGQPALKKVPVVVLSSSPIPQDIEKAKKLGAREYIVKMDYSTIRTALTDLSARYFCHSLNTWPGLRIADLIWTIREGPLKLGFPFHQGRNTESA